MVCTWLREISAWPCLAPAWQYIQTFLSSPYSHCGAENAGKARGVVFLMETLMINQIAKTGTSVGLGFDSRDTPRDPGTSVSVENICI